MLLLLEETLMSQWFVSMLLEGLTPHSFRFHIYMLLELSILGKENCGNTNTTRDS